MAAAPSLYGRHLLKTRAYDTFVQAGGGAILACFWLPQITQSFSAYARIAELTREINTTVITFGDEEKQSIAKQKLSIASGSGSSVAATAARQAYFSKNLKGKAISGHEDLVAEVTEGNVKLDEVKPESLPEQYRKLSKPELAAAIKEQQGKRKKLQSRMNKLVSERNAWLKKAMEKRRADNKDNGFDAKIRRAVKEQGEKKGIQYKS